MSFRIRIIKWYGQLVVILQHSQLARFNYLRKLHHKIISLIKPNHITAYGHTIFLDPTDAVGLALNTYNYFGLHFLENQIHQNDVVVDVGAHIGSMTLSFARQVGNDGKVYAFEPDPGNYKLLTKNIYINGYENVNLINAAVSDHDGIVTLYQSDNSATHRIYPWVNSKSEIKIQVIQLDRFFYTIEKQIDLVKIDVEGIEPLVLKGMSHILNNHSDTKLFIEFVPAWIKQAGFNPEDVIHFLKKLNYKIYNVDQINKSIYAISAQELISRYPSSSTKGTDLWAVRN